jgi:ectoine hydroxylase-related dioxygenase (phytanoyl-CoA dioxygenase family)
MLNTLRNILFSQKHKLIERNFNYQVFKDSSFQIELEKQGFVHLKNVVDKDQLNDLMAVYKDAYKNFDILRNNPDFLNTLTIDDKDLKRYIREKVTPVLEHALSGFMNMEQLYLPFGCSYCVYFPNTKKNFKPHQDTAYVDETKTYSIVVWLPLVETDIQNGCLHVLPKSHFWDNTLRSASMIWAFEKYSSLLWKYLKPIPTNLGDVIVFDTSIVHGSFYSGSLNERVALNIPLLRKGTQMLSFHPVDDRKGYLYSIDEHYFIDESLYSEPSKRYPKIGKVKLNNTYSYNDVMHLIKQSSDKL